MGIPSDHNAWGSPLSQHVFSEVGPMALNRGGAHAPQRRARSIVNCAPALCSLCARAASCRRESNALFRVRIGVDFGIFLEEDSGWRPR